LPLPQVAIGAPEAARDDGDTKRLWASLVRRLKENPRQLGALVKEAKAGGLDPTCFQGESPACNLGWDLLSFSFWLQLVIDVFHNMNEGHCNLLYTLFSVLSPFAEAFVREAWEDEYTWEPTVGKWRGSVRKSKVEPASSHGGSLPTALTPSACATFCCLCRAISVAV